MDLIKILVDGGILAIVMSAFLVGVVLLMPFFVDLLVLDWLIICKITPRFVVYPGTEGFAGYKDFGFHLRAHARGILLLIPTAVVIAGVTALA